MYKRILVISHNSFSQENSNGRTMAGFFKGWPKDKLAQFFTYNEIPNSDVCENYFRVTDKQALYSIWKGSVNTKFDKEEKKVEKNNLDKKNLSKLKNPLTLLIRNFVWNLNCWKGRYFNNWVDKFNPEIIFLQVGDTTYRLKLATYLAKERKIPLVLFNSEGYYFKESNYMIDSGITSKLYPLAIKSFRKQFKKTIDYASHTIYTNEQLKEDYDKVFNKPSSVIYTASDVIPTPYVYDATKKISLSYLGNLGIGRHESLIELAKIIQDIDPALTLDVYGKCPTSDIEAAFLRCSAINYKGFVSYNEVKKAMGQSDILFHVESFSDYYVEDIKYGFSTKIADSLMSGRCFFVYAPESLAFAKYFNNNLPDCIAFNDIDLKSKIYNLLTNDGFRATIAEKEASLGLKNHSQKVVTNSFLEIIDSYQ